MLPRRRLTGPFALVVAVTAACGPKHVAEPVRPSETMVVLLSDGDSGSTGRAEVSNAFGSTALAGERAGAVARLDRRPEPVGTVKETDVKRLFGTALAALPAAPLRYTLYFRFESDELTQASRDTLRDIVRAVKQRPVPDVVVVGHTDTTGTTVRNFELGLKRAKAVRDLLEKAGLDPSSVDVTSHGEADLLVKTPDATLEPRNRRVEVAVR